MPQILAQIRNSVDGIVGSYIMSMDGELLASDVPSLFDNELNSVSRELYQLIDIVRSERPISNIEIKAEQGFIHLATSEQYILGTFASKQADRSLLGLVLKKAIRSIGPEDVSGIPAHVPVKEELSKSPDEVDDETRVALCHAVKGKIRILYGDKMAEAKVSEAFAQAGAKRDTRNKNELKAAFDILADGIMAKMLGGKRARKFLDNLYQENGLK